MAARTVRRRGRGFLGGPGETDVWPFGDIAPAAGSQRTVLGSLALLSFLAVFLLTRTLITDSLGLAALVALAAVGGAALLAAQRTRCRRATRGLLATAAWLVVDPALEAWDSLRSLAARLRQGLALAADVALRGVGPHAVERRLVPDRLRRYALARSRSHCQVPGCSFRSALRLDLHYLDGDPTNNRASNLVALCRRHHRLAHGRELDREKLRAYLHPLRVFHAPKPCGGLGAQTTTLLLEGRARALGHRRSPTTAAVTRTASHGEGTRRRPRRGLRGARARP